MDLKDLDVVITPTIIYNVTYRTTGPIHALDLDMLETPTSPHGPVRINLFIPHPTVLNRYHLTFPGRMASLCGKASVDDTAVDRAPEGATYCRKCLLCLEARARRHTRETTAHIVRQKT